MAATLLAGLSRRMGLPHGQTRRRRPRMPLTLERQPSSKREPKIRRGLGSIR